MLGGPFRYWRSLMMANKFCIIAIILAILNAFKYSMKLKDHQMTIFEFDTKYG